MDKPNQIFDNFEKALLDFLAEFQAEHCIVMFSNKEQSRIFSCTPNGGLKFELFGSAKATIKKKRPTEAKMANDTELAGDG